MEGTVSSMFYAGKINVFINGGRLITIPKSKICEK